MAQGSWDATATSAAIVVADANRDVITIQMDDASATVALGLGEDAVLGEGIQLFHVGDTVTLRGHNARGAINVIGNTGKGSYQTGEVSYVSGPTP